MTTSKKIKSIGIFIPYFGQFPEWVDLFFESAKRNNTIDFFFYTDCDTAGYEAPNIHFYQITFIEYIAIINSKIDFEVNPPNAYKLCDFRPLFGHIHADIFKNYDFYGYCDLDLLFGDIRSFYTKEILEYFDVISTHSNIISGHLALYRNNSQNRKMYKKIYQWKKSLLEPKFMGIDETGMTNAHTMTFWDKFNKKFNTKLERGIFKYLRERKAKRLYLIEQHTTPFTPIPWLDGSINSDQPNEWYYKDGHITNNRDGDRRFIYLHFMNFKSSQWRHDGTTAPWEGKDKICVAQASDMEKGIVINKDGISPINE